MFDAVVIAIEPVDRRETIGAATFPIEENIVTLRVNHAWRGDVRGSIDVVTARQESACGFDFRLRQRYLVFADRRESDGRFAVSLCSNTRLFDGGDENGFLRSLSEPATGGRVFGAVQLYRRSVQPSNDPSMESFDAEIRLTGDGRRELTAHSAGGRYEFRNLQPGTYRVEIVVPAGYELYGEAARSAEVLNDRACAQEDYTVSPGRPKY